MGQRDFDEIAADSFFSGFKLPFLSKQFKTRNAGTVVPMFDAKNFFVKMNDRCFRFDGSREDAPGLVDRTVSGR